MQNYGIDNKVKNKIKYNIIKKCEFCICFNSNQDALLRILNAWRHRRLLAETSECGSNQSYEKDKLSRVLPHSEVSAKSLRCLHAFKIRSNASWLLLKQTQNSQFFIIFNFIFGYIEEIMKMDLTLIYCKNKKH